MSSFRSADAKPGTGGRGAQRKDGLERSGQAPDRSSRRHDGHLDRVQLALRLQQSDLKGLAEFRHIPIHATPSQHHSAALEPDIDYLPVELLWKPIDPTTDQKVEGSERGGVGSIPATGRKRGETA
jgi:hypothetical protein